MMADGGAGGSRAAAAVRRGIGWAAAGGLALLGVALCLTRATDPDLWWHLASGDLVRGSGRVPRGEPFSCTVPGLPYVEIHWAFQAGLSWLYERGGLAALTVLKAALIAGLFAGLWFRARRAVPAAALLWGTLLALLACQERFQVRPEIVSWILLAVTVALLERALEARDRRRRRLLLWLLLPALVAVWVNVQSLFILGPVLAALALVAALYGELRAGREGRDPDRPIDHLVGVALTGAAALLNPYGARAIRLPFEQLFEHLGGQSLVSRTIAEFQPTLSADPTTPSIHAFFVFAVLTAAAFAADARRARPFELLAAAATLFLALRARRNIPLFVIPCLPWMLRHATGAFGSWRASRGAAAGPAAATTGSAAAGAGAAGSAAMAGAALASLFLTWSVVTDRFFLGWPTERWWGMGEIPHLFPEGAARFVEEAGVPGNVFHSLWAGGYLIHAWKGDRRVFIDGRNDPFLDGVLETYLKTVGDPRLLDETARRYQIAAVLWPHARALEGRALLGELARGRGWALAYLDAGGAVYVRADVAAALRIGLDPFRFAAGPELYARLQEEIDERPYGGPPLAAIGLAQFFSVSGDPAGAEFFYREALERLPRRASLLHACALALERQGRPEEARSLHERAVEAEPGYLPAAASLGIHRLEEGRLEEAERLLERAYGGGVRDAPLLSARARLLERRGRLREAVAAYGEALRAAPRDVAVHLDLARFHARHGEREPALAIAARAAEIDRDDPAPPLLMARLLESMGRSAAALAVLRDAGRPALDRIAAGPSGGTWATRRSGPAEIDLALLRLLARLESEGGDPGRAAEIHAALARAADAGRQEGSPGRSPTPGR
jgi:tetratricopeptide (TPR) repeat protein